MQSRSSKGLLLPPSASPTHSNRSREEWLYNAEKAFVAPGLANRRIFRSILNELWPEGHGIPGPHISQDRIRELIDNERADAGLPPYRDPFRRMRELQGEEGFTSIMKEGVKYQLQSLSVRQKREPRSRPSKALWSKILDKFDYRCAHCGGQAPTVRLSPDHKIPRARGGSNDEENWQPLCEQCNNLKSSACQGCQLICQVCSWAYPADYKPIKIDDANKEEIRRQAEKRGEHQSDFVNRILRDHFNRN